MKKLSILLVLLLCSFSYGLSRVKPIIGKQAYEVKMGESNDVTVIGNSSKANEFQAHVKMDFFKGENSISFHEEGVKGIHTFANEKITLNLDKRKLEWFKSDGVPNQGGKDALLHWVDIYEEKPASNKWSLRIDDANQFDYLYQPTLVSLIPQFPGSYIEYFTKNGEDMIRLVYAPGGVMISDERELTLDGGIVVKHKTKRDHAAGGINYRNGQVMMILRPKAVDTNGKWAWCDIEVEDGVYTRIIPLKFYNDNTVVYPVRINDVFGSNTGGGTGNNWSAEYIAAHYKGTPDASGSATSIEVYGNDRGTNTDLCMGIFADVASEPLTLLRDTGATTITASTGWFPDNFDTPFDIVNGTNYWLGSCTELGHQTYWVAGAEAAFFDYHGSFSDDTGTLQNMVDPTTTTVRDYQIFINYTPAGGATAAQIIIIHN